MLSLDKLFQINTEIIQETLIEKLFDNIEKKILHGKNSEEETLNILKEFVTKNNITGLTVVRENYKNPSGIYFYDTNCIILYIPNDKQKYTISELINIVLHETAHAIIEKKNKIIQELIKQKIKFKDPTDISNILHVKEPPIIRKYLEYYCQPSEENTVPFTFAYTIFHEYPHDKDIIRKLFNATCYSYFKFEEKSQNFSLEDFKTYFQWISRQSKDLHTFIEFSIMIEKSYMLDKDFFNKIQHKLFKIFSLTKKYYIRISRLLPEYTNDQKYEPFPFKDIRMLSHLTNKIIGDK